MPSLQTALLNCVHPPPGWVFNPHHLQRSGVLIVGHDQNDVRPLVPGRRSDLLRRVPALRPPPTAARHPAANPAAANTPPRMNSFRVSSTSVISPRPRGRHARRRQTIPTHQRHSSPNRTMPCGSGARRRDDRETRRPPSRSRHDQPYPRQRHTPAASHSASFSPSCHGMQSVSSTAYRRGRARRRCTRTAASCRGRRRSPPAAEVVLLAPPHSSVTISSSRAGLGGMNHRPRPRGQPQLSVVTAVLRFAPRFQVVLHEFGRLVPAADLGITWEPRRADGPPWWS